MERNSDKQAEVADPHKVEKKRPAPRGTASYARKRAVTACQVCRARRTKCDNGKPKCSFCLKTGAECIQSPVDLSSFDPASLHILEQLEEIKQLVVNCNQETGKARGATTLSAVTTTSQHGAIDGDRSWVLPPQTEALLGRIEGGDSVSLLSILKLQDISSPISTLANSSASIVGDIEIDLDSHKCTILVDNFFNYVHVKNPILDEEATRRLIRNVSIHGVDWSVRSCLALLVCALGSIATPFGPSVETEFGAVAYSNAQGFFHAAQKRLGACLVNNGVVEAQCLFLAGVFLMNVFKPYEAWKLFSQSLAACQIFDLLCDDHQTSTGLDTHTAAEQSIYWSAWKSEQEVRRELKPHDFCYTRTTEELYPPFFPTPPPSIGTPQGFPNESKAHQEQTGWYFYLTEISLRRFQHRMADEMLNLVTDNGSSFVQSLAQTFETREAEILAWKEALPANMSLDTPPELDDVCKFVLRGHVHNLYEMIHWPFIHVVVLTTLHNSPGDPGILQPKTVLHLAEAGLRLHVERIEINKKGFAHRHHGTWPMIRSCSRSALVLLAAVMGVQSGALSVQLPVGWRNAVEDVIALNHFWQREVLDARHRLPILETALAGLSIL